MALSEGAGGGRRRRAYRSTLALAVDSALRCAAFTHVRYESRSSPESRSIPADGSGELRKPAMPRAPTRGRRGIGLRCANGATALHREQSRVLPRLRRMPGKGKGMDGERADEVAALKHHRQ